MGCFRDIGVFGDLVPAYQRWADSRLGKGEMSGNHFCSHEFGAIASVRRRFGSDLIIGKGLWLVIYLPNG